jgi:hypothetical protein
MMDRRHDPAEAEDRRRNAPAMLRRSGLAARTFIKLSKAQRRLSGAATALSHGSVAHPKSLHDLLRRIRSAKST